MKLDANIALLHECEKSSPSKSMHTHPKIVEYEVKQIHLKMSKKFSYLSVAKSMTSGNTQLHAFTHLNRHVGGPKNRPMNGAGQEVFVLAVVLNPSLRVSCFAPGSPHRQFPKPWTCVPDGSMARNPTAIFVEPFTIMFSVLASGQMSMGLNQHQDQAKRDVSDVFNFG
ncbi:hypothetical protein K503DRAFT_311208 [Rhizopogon vinicolor AM-OR11-026]|uniref:Uncharacterized protein n=1 Tax=Rhizopogon vinicolor AM-OR11-026 TaxID=1314800 RepID=A0A1B7MUR6_9AGAM|nr:hypothetical protein K503DRAFT_311208 [Rhizopogon vinicolor AM-OR11-026]